MNSQHLSPGARQVLAVNTSDFDRIRVLAIIIGQARLRLADSTPPGDTRSVLVEFY